MVLIAYIVKHMPVEHIKRLQVSLSTPFRTVAQRAEHITDIDKVVGAIPTGPTSILPPRKGGKIC